MDKLVTITVKGNSLVLSGPYPEELVRKETSYYVEGYRFQTSYNTFVPIPGGGRQRVWDGKEHLFDKKSRSAPAGLAGVLQRSLEKHGYKVELVCENRPPPTANDDTGFQLHSIAFGEGKFDYQRAAAEAAIKQQRGILKMATNSGKTAVAAAVIKYLKIPTLFMVPGVDLLRQTRKSFARMLEVPRESIGALGDGEFSFGQWITIATPDTMHGRQGFAEMQEWHNRWQLLFIDECHGSGSETWFEVLQDIQAFYRIGLSGTPLDRTDGADLRLIAQTGDVIYEVSNKLLISRGVSVPVEISLKSIKGESIKSNNWKSVQKTGVIENELLNADVVDWTHARVADGKQVVILVKEVKHGKFVEKALKEAGIKQLVFMHGELPSQTREEALEGFTAGTVKVLIGTSVLYTGIDTPNIDCLVFADLGKSRIAVLQALGRGLRAKPGKDKLLVRDYANFRHKWLTDHSLRRLKIYKSEDCFRFHRDE